MLFETRDGSTALIIFVVQIFWLSLILPLTAMLQGAGKVKVPALLLIGGLVVKVIRQSYPRSNLRYYRGGDCWKYWFCSNYTGTCSLF